MAEDYFSLKNKILMFRILKDGILLFACLCEVLRPSLQLSPCRAGQLPVNTVPGQHFMSYT